tara:strand:- start:5282 stop:5671 length:390 start_codon:yes stop_codon:yes gene_type:complete
MKPKVRNWINQLENGVIKSKTTTILYAIHSHTKNKGFTTVYELRNELPFPHQTLTAILSMVQDEGLIAMYGEEKINDSLFQKIRYARPEERTQLIYLREHEKFTQWVVRGLKDFSKFLPQSIEEGLKGL